MYLLDTNVLSELMRLKPNPHVEARFESEKAELLTSAICIEEIRYGSKIGPPNKLWARFSMEILPHVTVVSFDQSLAIAAGDLRAVWKQQGTPAGYGDGLIASTAKAKNLILVTRNVRHFDHVQDLKVENWFDLPSSKSIQL